MTSSSARIGRRLFTGLAVASFMPMAAVGQGAARDTTIANRAAPTRMTAVVVTATRTAKSVFDVPTPVAVVDRVTIDEKMPNTPADLFRDLPGLDVTGVGANQVRPSIRGQRGQRILLLQDGIRLNNSRRQQSFGEIPGLVDVGALERVEVVRGPASVLYGTDAIGGAVNLITRVPVAEGLHGTANYRYSTHDGQQRVSSRVGGRFGAFDVQVGGTSRDAGDYRAPTGSYGDITLAADTTVFDTGVEDNSLEAYVGYRPVAASTVFARYERYRADTAGFGWVDPAAYAPGQPFIQILYPFQRFDKMTLGYRGTRLGLPVADQLNVTAYGQSNERRLTNDVFVSFGPPGAGVSSQSENYTDLTTLGFRVEATKYALDRVLLTYGFDLFRDDSENTDSSLTTMIGFGPIPPTVSAVPLTPDATFRSAGAFVQGDVQVTDRASVILGGRFQDTRAATRETPGRTDPLVAYGDRTFVGTANLLYRVRDDVTLVGSVGRAFRSPNLIERFFNGLTPEGAAYQIPNPDLKPETSLNVDVGVRYRSDILFVEAFVFQNEIRDGIRIQENVGDTLNGLPTYSNVNVEKLRFRGIEVSADLLLPLGIEIGGSFSRLSTRDVLNENNPVGDAYSGKVLLHAGYRDPGGRFWAGYYVRHNGDRKDSELSGPLGASPVGTVLPAFTTHSVRGGVTLFRRGMQSHGIGFTVANLTNELYAEFANASFFRPEPGRSVTVSWTSSF